MSSLRRGFGSKQWKSAIMQQDALVVTNERGDRGIVLRGLPLPMNADSQGQPMDYSEMARRFDEGTILLGVDRPGARKFFTDLGLRRIRDLIGEVPYFEWLLVRSSFMGAPICLLGSLAFAALAFHWWTILVAPFTLLVFIYWWVT